MPKKTVESIIGTGNDYCLQVKGNQPNLLKQLEDNSDGAIPVDVYETNEIQKGRMENRHVAVYDTLQHIELDKWLSMRYFIIVNRSGFRQGVYYEETHHFISSCQLSKNPQAKNGVAQFFATGIRKHWSIENNLHWNKDVYMKEDDSGLKNKKQATICAVLRNLVYNIFKVCKLSVKLGIEHFTTSISEFYPT